MDFPPRLIFGYDVMYERCGKNAGVRPQLLKLDASSYQGTLPPETAGDRELGEKIMCATESSSSFSSSKTLQSHLSFGVNKKERRRNKKQSPAYYV